jgi:hypothetical protein
MRIVRLMMLLGLCSAASAGIHVQELQDYVFGGYTGEFEAPPNADLNPKRAIVVTFDGRREKLVFWHEASYCPFFELADGSGVCFQFFEGNDGWAELFNQFGRMERNSFVDILENSGARVWIRWTYFGVNRENGAATYRGTEDFYCFPSGLVLRRQSFTSLMPRDHRGYAREPIELIGMCPAGRTWKDVLRREGDERHALAALDPFSDKHYDVFWTPKQGAVWESTQRRAGCTWKELDDAAGTVLAMPMNAGTPFCIFGEASGFPASLTRIKEHTHKDTGGIGWNSMSWDHWPIGWLNSQGHNVDATTLPKYPNHFSPAGMDLFAMKNEDVERGEYWSLIGVGGDDMEAIRSLAKRWLGSDSPKDPGKLFEGDERGREKTDDTERQK